MNDQQRTTSCRYLLIGNGRTARHLAHYFQLLGIAYDQWSRQWGNALPATLINAADRILVLISDREIAPFLVQYPMLHEKTVIHCSGALVLSHAFSAHPLTSFSAELFEDDFYPRIPFVLEEEGPEFHELLPGLPNLSIKIPRDQKPFYHSLCVLSGNFTVLLWQKFFAELNGRFNVPVEIVFSYVEAVVHNIQKNPTTALTGPLTRADEATIQKNLQALGTDPYADVYRAFVAAYQKEFL